MIILVCYSLYKIRNIPDITMNNINFTAFYRGKRRRFEIGPLNVNKSIHLYIDKFYYGQFDHREGRWVFLPQNDDTFTPEQIAILEGQLERHWQEQQG